MPKGVYPRTPAIRASLSAHHRERLGPLETCRVEDCSKLANRRSARLCEAHHAALRRYGTTDGRPQRRKYPPKYRTAHKWVEEERGKAATHNCADCGKQAGHWSFAHRRVPEGQWLWTEDRARPFTGNPADYDPRCYGCASRYDRPY